MAIDAFIDAGVEFGVAGGVGGVGDLVDDAARLTRVFFYR